MPHSYEEIRSVALDILAGREQVRYPAEQYEHIKAGIAEVFARREGRPRDGLGPSLDRVDSELYLEVFWELFRQGVITLGLNDSNREFPHCRLSEFGRRVLENQQAYFFHDVTSYTNVIRVEIHNIDAVTLLYLQEAMQAFKAGCILSATVMLGVATEHTFLLMLEAIEANPRHQPTYRRVFTERTLLQKVNCFKAVLDNNLAGLAPEIREGSGDSLRGYPLDNPDISKSVRASDRPNSWKRTGVCVAAALCSVWQETISASGSFSAALRS